MKHETAALQLLPELGVVFDDAVVDHGEYAVVGQVRMGVGDGGGTVGGPAGVADAAHAGEVRAVVGLLTEVPEMSGGLGRPDNAAALHGDAGRVIPSVFQPLQPFQQQRPGVL